jgi:hypothetical protein
LFFAVTGNEVHCQEQPGSTLMDTILVKKGQTLITKNKFYTFSADTVIILPSSLTYEIKPSKSETFFNNLAHRADKNLITRELHNIIISNHSKPNNNDTIKNGASSLPYVYYTGRPIRKITIKQLDVFGPTIDDTSRIARSWIEKTGNKVHFPTREYLIRNSLIFKEGNLIDPIVLADNERLLRSLPYIEDARIIVKSSGGLTDSTDILVIVKDVWATAFNFEVDNVYSGRFEVWNRNLFGYGQELQSNLPWNSHKSPKIGTENSYIVNNLWRSFITAKIIYNNSFNTSILGTNLERKFFTPNIKYAGGASFNNIQTQSKLDYDTSKNYYSFSYNNYDLWVGRSLLLNRNSFTKMRHNLTFTSRIMRNHFFERPTITGTSYYDFQNKTLLFGAISYSRHSYFKSNYIYSFGRTEDIPIGSEITITAGKEFNEFFDRSYLATQVSWGTFLWNIGYLYTDLNIGSFFTNSEHDKQGIIDYKVNYFSPLVIVRKTKFRQFISFNYTHGINRFNKEYLTINENNGISGYRNDSVYGAKRFNMRWETVCFTPWIFYDFRFVLFINANHSWLVKSNEKLFDKIPYTSVKFGIRIRNERLAFNTIELSFSFYPNIPSGSKTRYVNLSGEPLLNPPNFLPKAPNIIPYK